MFSKLRLRLAVLLFIAGFIGLSYFLLDISAPVVYGQTANAWNIQRVGTDLNFYYSTGGISALQLNSNGQMRARTILDLDNANFIIDPSGTTNLNALGIGTTTPTAKLEVSGANPLRIIGSNGRLLFDVGAMDAANSGIATGYGTTYNGTAMTNSGFLQVESQGTAYRNFLLQPLGGNVGIGTTSPNAKLDVNGMAILGSSTAGGVKIGSAGALGAVIFPSVQNGNIRITDDSTAATRGINIANGGALGIRTAAPVSDLHIKQISNSQYSGGITLERADTVNQGAVFMGADNKLYFMSGGGYLTVSTASRLDVKGDARIDYKLAVNGYEPGACETNFGLCVGGSSGGQSNWTNTSDLRLKKNIQPISNALDKIMSLEGVYFDFIETDQGTYKTLPKGRQLGYIAQQVEEVLPEVVVTGGDGMKMMSYGNITALLSEGIKEQQRDLKAQEEIIQKQQEMINDLQKDLTALSEEIKSLKQ